MNKGYSLRQAAKLSGVPTMTFHAWKEKRLVTPDVADNKGNISLFSEAMIERAKEIDAKRKAKKSVDNSGNLFEELALVATGTNGEVEPLEKEKVDDTDANIQEVVEISAPVETAETPTTMLLHLKTALIVFGNCKRTFNVELSKSVLNSLPRRKKSGMAAGLIGSLPILIGHNKPPIVLCVYRSVSAN